MPSAGLSDVSLAVLRSGVENPKTVARYQAKARHVSGSTCVWWTGAVSARGHGRFWLDEVDGRDIVVIAHRFGWALEYGVDELLTVPVLGHRCDNPLCQRLCRRHVTRSSPVENAREWAARRHTIGNSLRDGRGSRGRSRDIRDLLRGGATGAQIATALGAGLHLDLAQLPLWHEPGAVNDDTRSGQEPSLVVRRATTCEASPLAPRCDAPAHSPVSPHDTASRQPTTPTSAVELDGAPWPARATAPEPATAQ